MNFSIVLAVIVGNKSALKQNKVVMLANPEGELRDMAAHKKGSHMATLFERVYA
jgi:hypothetical protein